MEESSEVVHNLALLHGVSQRNLVEDPVADSNLALCDVEDFEHLFKLLLDGSSTHRIVPGLKSLQQLDNVQSESCVCFPADHELPKLVFVPEDASELVNKVSKHVVDVDLLGNSLGKLVQEASIC